MRKFVVQSKRGATVITEVEVEFISPIEDPSVMWLQPGEYKARILKPESFHMKVEKVIDGKRETVMEPDIWFSHAFYEDEGQAVTAANKLIEMEFIFNQRKYGKEYTDADLAAAFLAIQLIKFTA